MEFKKFDAPPKCCATNCLAFLAYRGTGLATAHHLANVTCNVRRVKGHEGTRTSPAIFKLE